MSLGTLSLTWSPKVSFIYSENIHYGRHVLALSTCRTLPSSPSLSNFKRSPSRSPPPPPRRPLAEKELNGIDNI